MTRKSQLEKFEARYGKMRKDTNIIREEEAKRAVENKTIEKKAENIAKEHNVSTEEIFAIITRESISGFVQLWNNSMESTIRETIRGEVREIIREVVQEQMVEAYKGIVKGMTDVESIVKEEMTDFVKNEFVGNPIMGTPIQNDINIETPEQHMKEPEREKRVGTFKKGKGGRPKGSGLKYTRIFDEELKQAVTDAHYEGVNVLVGKEFKLSTSRNNTLYQKFAKKNKGIKGAWKEYVENIIPALKKS